MTAVLVQYEKPRRCGNTPGVELVNMSDQPVSNRTSVNECSVEGCTRQAKAKGLCKTHHNAYRCKLKRDALRVPYTGPVFIGLDRFDSKVQESTENFHNGIPCWEWHRTKNNGYGYFGIGGGSSLAHRVAYEALKGPIPAGLHIDHLCRNRRCVNPAHLEAVTQAENNWRSPIWAGNKTHCVHGHEYTPENTYYRPDGNGRIRACLTCHKIRKRKTNSGGAK